MGCSALNQNGAHWNVVGLERLQEYAVSEIKITYFSDALCVWAYVAQARIEAVKEKFGTSVRIEHRFCSVFGDTAAKIASIWKDRGGYEGFGTHHSMWRTGSPTSWCTPKFGSRRGRRVRQVRICS
jgi:hypothetical protein